MSIKCVAVYLGSKPGNSPIFTESATLLGKELALNGISVVYGGTTVGTMKALADGVLEGNGKLLGVFPRKFMHKGILNPQLGETYITEDLKDRKSKMEELSDACVIMPGSYGNMDELFEYAVNNQLDGLQRPVFLLNLNGFYDNLLLQLDVMVNHGFLTPELRKMVINCPNVEAVIKHIK